MSADEFPGSISSAMPVGGECAVNITEVGQSHPEVDPPGRPVRGQGGRDLEVAQSLVEVVLAKRRATQIGVVHGRGPDIVDYETADDRDLPN